MCIHIYTSIYVKSEEEFSKVESEVLKDLNTLGSDYAREIGEIKLKLQKSKGLVYYQPGLEGNNIYIDTIMKIMMSTNMCFISTRS